MDNIVSSLKPVAQQVATGYVTKKTASRGNNLATALTPVIPAAMELAAGFITKKGSGSAAGEEDLLAVEAYANNSHHLEDLLEKDPFADRVPALVAAAGNGKISALDILLNTSATPRSSRHSHPHESTRVSRDTQKKWLNSIFHGTTPLLAAVERKHAKTADFLLESGADPDFYKKGGIPALQVAARAGDLDIVRSLVSYGANVDWTDSVGDTALIIASRWGLGDVANCLVQNGANLDIKNAKGGTALLVAARHDCVDILQLLVSKGADVKAQDRKGQTVLHRAVDGKWLVEQVPASVKRDMLKILLEAGADINLKDDSGKTASQTVSWMEGGRGLRKLLDDWEFDHRRRSRKQAIGVDRRMTA